jgi:hypothetical protein
MPSRHHSAEGEEKVISLIDEYTALNVESRNQGNTDFQKSTLLLDMKELGLLYTVLSMGIFHNPL